MKGTTMKRWSALSGVLGLGIMVGLVIAGSWNVTPSGLAESRSAVERPAPTTGAEEILAAQEAASVADLPVELQRPPTISERTRQEGLPSLREVAMQVRPAVVSVEVTRWVQGQFHNMNFDPEDLPEGMREFFRFEQQPEEDLEPRQAQGEGSGFIFSREGYILTNNHVVENAVDVVVVLPDKRRFKAEVVGRDEITDVAVIKIDTNERLPIVDLGDSDSVGVGDWVLALGNPLQFDFTVTAGIVGAKGRGNLNIGPVEGNIRQMIQDFIQTDAAINRGNSGGPLVDLNGQVVGMNTAIASQTGFSEGYGFAIPIKLVRSVAEDLIRHGEVKRAWLGITFNEITSQYAKAVSLPDNPPHGAVVQTIVSGGPAGRAGIEREDIILEIDGVSIENSGQLQTLVSLKKPNTRMSVVVYRGGNSRKEGERIELTVRLRERPALERTEAAEPEFKLEDKLGLKLSELTGQLRQQNDYDGEGLYVEGLEAYGPVYRANPNLARGGWILAQVDGEPVPDVDAYQRIVRRLRDGDAVLIRMYVRGAPPDQQFTTFAVEIQ
jgi:serine protease Do